MNKLAGNELSWIMTLAHRGLRNMTKEEKAPIDVMRQLREILAPFHYRNFIYGDKETTWYLLSEEEYNKLYNSPGVRHNDLS